QRRYRHPQRLGSTAETAMLSGSDERFEIIKHQQPPNPSCRDAKQQSTPVSPSRLPAKRAAHERRRQPSWPAQGTAEHWGHAHASSDGSRTSDTPEGSLISPLKSKLSSVSHSVNHHRIG